MSSTSIQSSPSARALQDVRDGWGQRELWGHLGWQDIRQRYRRSLLGPLWITISMAVTAIALGILYAGLFGNSLEEQLPYILVGFIVWGFIAGCINEGSEVFIANVGLITHLPAPISVHVPAGLAPGAVLRPQPGRLRGDADHLPAVAELGEPDGDPRIRAAGAQRRLRRSRPAS